jgi:hypothetical protein
MARLTADAIDGNPDDRASSASASRGAGGAGGGDRSASPCPGVERAGAAAGGTTASCWRRGEMVMPEGTTRTTT